MDNPGFHPNTGCLGEIGFEVLQCPEPSLTMKNASLKSRYLNQSKHNKNSLLRAQPDCASPNIFIFLFFFSRNVFFPMTDSLLTDFPPAFSCRTLWFCLNPLNAQAWLTGDLVGA